MLGAVVDLGREGGIVSAWSLTIGEEKSEFSELWLCGCASIQFSRVMGAREVGDEHQQRNLLGTECSKPSSFQALTLASRDLNKQASSTPSTRNLNA